jgi:G3E family GTPase
MDRRTPLPLTVLAGLSATLRDATVAASLAGHPARVAVVHDLDELHTRGIVWSRVRSAAGVLAEFSTPLAHGCLSCTLREVVLPTLVDLADDGRWHDVVLALPPALEPAAVVHPVESGRVGDVRVRDAVRVDTVTTVVDAVLLLEHLGGDDLLAERGLAAAPDDRRNIAEVTARQIEYADVLLLANTPRLPAPVTDRLCVLLRHLAPGADVRTGLTAPVVSTGRFDRARADAWTGGGAVPPVPPEPNGCGITSVVWRADRPVHPGRLAASLRSVVDGVLRSRGALWLANRPTERVAWESAGQSAALGALGTWTDSGELAGCALLLTGIDLVPGHVQATLDACLLTDAEFAAGPPEWRRLDDPFHAALGAARQETA